MEDVTMSLDANRDENSEELLGIGVAARLAQLSPDTLRRAVKAGRLPSVRTPGGQHRFRRSDIEALSQPRGPQDEAHDAGATA